MKQWLSKKCDVFSLIAGEDVTNEEVILTHIGFLIFVAVCVVAEWF